MKKVYKYIVIFVFVFMLIFGLAFFGLNKYNTIVSSNKNLLVDTDGIESTQLKSLVVEDFEDDLTFYKDIYSYNISIYDSYYYLNINAVPEDQDATVKISGREYLINNTGSIIVKVSLNGNSSTYTINYTKGRSTSDLSYSKTYSYTGGQQIFTVPYSGYYKIRAWGAGGGKDGKYGGPGGYSIGVARLVKDEVLYVYVGGVGASAAQNSGGGYNGGGNAGNSGSSGGGGGASHVASVAGVMSSLSSYIGTYSSTTGTYNSDKIIIVAGGGGGGGNSNDYYGGGGGAVGHSGNASSGGSQTAAGTGNRNGSFGQGGHRNGDGGGGGGGFWGGAAGNGDNNGSGGSGFIGSSRLISYGDITKHMTCYWCSTNNNPETKTISNSNMSSSFLDDYASNTHGRIIFDRLAVPSNNYYLSNITSDTGTWNKVFNPIEEDYMLSVSMYTHKVNLYANMTDSSTQSVTGTGEYILNIGYNYATISVTADNGEVKNYNITILRESLKGKHSSELRLINYDDVGDVRKTIYVDKGVLVYDLTLPSYKIANNIEAIPYDSEATVEITGSDFIIDDGTIRIKVSAPGVDDTLYIINYTLKNYYQSITKNYSATSSQYTYTIPTTGYYKLEAWGASGGNDGKVGGDGGYSIGVAFLTEGETLYMNVGTRGSNSASGNGGGYNGGGNAGGSGSSGGGGGATSVATVSGTLPNLGAYIGTYSSTRKTYDSDKILIVAGGGGGGGNSNDYYGCGGGAAGHVGNASTAGSQTAAGTGNLNGSFGQGGHRNGDGGGGGGGFWGGAAGNGDNNGSGGSGFIGSSRLISYGDITKHMSCYNCPAQSDPEILTYAKGTHGSSFVADVASTSGGYLKVEMLEFISENNFLTSLTVVDDELEDTGTWDKEFDPSVYDYKVTVDTYLNYVTVTGEAANAKSVDGSERRFINLGDNYFTLTVTAQNGSVRTYTVNVYRAYSSVPTTELMLIDFNLTDGNVYERIFCEHDVYDYDLTILSGIYSLDVIAVPYDQNATVKYSGFGYIKTSKVAYIIVSNPNASPSQTIYAINIIKGEAASDVEFNYTGTYQTFTAEYAGYYQVEAWGAQGGNDGELGGLGGYATGVVRLSAGETLYIYVGGAGNGCVAGTGGGYNGGGNAGNSGCSGGGGGATHIAFVPGLLNTLESYKGFYNNAKKTYVSDDILIVAGGGSGAGHSASLSGSGGGYTGATSSGTGGTQQTYGTGTNNASFGQGGHRSGDGGGGGGGFYGGGAAYGDTHGGGGSGYIGSSRLQSLTTRTKHMTCYNCPTSEDSEIYTETTTRYSSSPTPDYAKSGNGYAKLTLLNLSTNNFLSNITIKDIVDLDDIKDLTLNETFDMNKTTYTITVDPDITSIRLSAKPEDSKATIDGLGDFDVPVGTTDFDIVVTAENGDKKTYTVKVTRQASTNTKPTAIYVSGLIKSLCNSNDTYCKLYDTSNNVVDTYDSDVEEYRITVPSRIKQLKWIVDKSNVNQVVTGDGISELPSGLTTVTVEVESEYCAYYYPELNALPPEDPEEEYTPPDKSDPKYANCFRTYTYNVTRIVSDDADLKTLKIDNVETNPQLDPASDAEIEFDLNYVDPDVFDYFFSVPKSWDHVKYLVAEADAHDDGAEVDINGNENFVVGESNLVEIVVTAPDGVTQRTYRLHVFREFEKNVYVNNLAIKDHIFDQEFSKYNFGPYKVTIPNDETSAQITFRVESDTTTAAFTRTRTTSISESHSGQDYTVDITGIPVNTTYYELNTTAEDNNYTGTYTIEITRLKNSDSTLKSIIAKTDDTNWTLDPVFDPSVHDYTINVDAGVTSVTLVPEVNVNTSSISMPDGESIHVGNTVKRVIVTAEDKTYTIYNFTIVRPPFSDATLKELTIKDSSDNSYTVKDINDNEFDPSVNVYYVTVPNDVYVVNINGVKNNVFATVTGNGKYYLSVGENNIVLSVTAENGVVNYYNIYITREPNSNPELTSITSSKSILNETFTDNTVTYTMDVTYDVDYIDLTYHFAASTTSAKTYSLSDTEYDQSKVPLVTGDNELKIITKAEDNSELTYYLTITKDASTINTLENVVINETRYTPVFDPNENNYYAYLPYDVRTVHFKVTKGDDAENYTIAVTDSDLIVDGDEVSGLKVDENVISIIVTPEDGTINTYVFDLTVIPEGASNTKLKKLTVSNGTLSPTFDPNVLHYDIEVPYEVTTDTIDATVEAPLEVDDTTPISGLGTYTLPVGITNAYVIVHGIDGYDRVYSITFNRLPNDDSMLKTLTVKDLILTPGFSPNTVEYDMDVDSNSINFTSIVPNDPNASYEVVGNSNLSEIGTTYVVKIIVTAENGTDKTEYKINAKRIASSNANLADLGVKDFTINPTFTPTNTIYYLTVPNDVSNVLIYAEPEAGNPTITGDGIQPVYTGMNYKTIEVVSEDGSVSKSYTIAITREESDNTNVTYLEILNGTMNKEFNNDGDDTYNVEVYSSEESLDFKVVLEDPNATYRVSNNSFSSNTTVTLTVVAEDNSTRTITFNVTVKPMVSALLKNLYVDNYELESKFNSNIFYYNLTINYEDEEIVPHYEKVDPDATVVVSKCDDLVVGSTEVTFTVTDSENNNTETYTINVTRNPYVNNFLEYLYNDYKTGEFKEDFSKTKYIYTLDVDKDFDEITLFGSPTTSQSTITITTTNEAGNSDSIKYKLGAYKLNKGENKFTVNVSLNGYTRKYHVYVNRAFDSQKDLFTLTVRSGTEFYKLTPEFTSDHTTYDLTVENDINNIIFAGTIPSTASVYGLGKHELNPLHNIFNIVVTAEDGTTKTYTIDVYKNASNNAYLTDLVPSVGSLDPAFAYETNVYDLVLDNSVSLLSFTVMTEDPNATYTGTDAEIVPDGISVRTITVTAEDNTPRTYTINVVKFVSDDADLLNLKVKGYSYVDQENLTSTITFNKDTYEYYCILNNSKKTISKSDFEYSLSYNKATISFQEETNISTKGFTEYNVIVTAEDSVTKNIYKVFFKRQVGTSSRIIKVNPSVGYLETDFDNTTNDYYWVIPRKYIVSVDSLGYVLEDENATVRWTLNDKTYTFVVTSEDLENTSTYTFTTKNEGMNYYLDNITVKDNKNINYNLTPEFESDTNAYDVHVYKNATKVTITSEISIEDIDVMIYKDSDSSNKSKESGTFVIDDDIESYSLDLMDGEIEVGNYTLNVIRDIEVDTNLANLFIVDNDSVCNGSLCKIKPNFKGTTSAYKVNVPYQYDTLTVGYTTSNEQQTVKIKDVENYITNGEYELSTGANLIYVEVYDGLNKLTKTYNLTITRNKSNNAYLESLKISSTGVSEYELSPEFDKETLEYEIVVDPTVTEVTVEAVPEALSDGASTIINGYNYLEPGYNDLTIAVLAPDRKTEKTYIVHIFVGDPTKSSFLTSITVSSGKIWKLVPDFKKNTTGYVVNVESSTEFVMIEAFFEEGKNIITDGTGQFNVSTGVNVFNITSTLYEDDDTTVISETVYTITVIRPISSNVYLTDLKVTATNEEVFLNANGYYALSKPFDKGTTEYGLTVSPNVRELVIEASVQDDSSRYVVYGNHLVTGLNYVDVVVFNEDNTLTKTYQITVTVLPSDDASLSGIKVFNTYKDEFDNDQETVYGIDEEVFDKDTLTYNLNLAYDVDRVNILATPSFDNASVEGNGLFYLDYGANVVVINVTAENGEDDLTYTLNLYRAYDIYLSNILEDNEDYNLNEEFDKTNDTYTMTVDNSVKSISFEGIPEENNVTVTYSLGDGSSALSTVTADGILYTGVGLNKLVITVTAPDNTFKYYYVNVTREQSDNNYLEYLEFDEGILREPFEKTRETYTMYIVDTYTSLDLEKASIIPEDSTAKYTISGYAGLSKTSTNTVTIAVTSESGKVRNYVVEVTLKPEEFFMHYLKSLRVSYKVQGESGQETVEATLSPTFVQSTRSYTVTVPYSVSSVTTNAITLNEDDDAILSASTESGIAYGDATYSVNFGRNVINIKVASRLNNDDTFGMYKVIVYRSKNPTATLRLLAEKNHVLSPSFNSSRLNYSINITSSVKKLDITAIPTDPGATVEIIGNGNFHEGANTVTIHVTAADGTATKDYKITANCTLSDNNYLSSFEVKDYSINPTFVKTNTGVYIANVTEDITSVFITAIPEDSDASLSIITSSATYSKNSISYKLTPGNNYIYATVTSAAGNTRTYTLNVFRSYSTDNRLKELVVSDGVLVPDFDPEKTSYTVTLEDDLAFLDTITVIGIKNDSKATLEGNGEYQIRNGNNEIIISVKSQSGDVREYKVNVIKVADTSNRLETLEVYEGELSPAFTNEGMQYYVTVPYEVTSLDLTEDVNVIPEDNNATIEITGNSDFKVGMNVVSIKVTSTKGVSRTYQVYVTRSVLASNYLSDLYIEGYDFTPSFDKTVLYYEVVVASSVDKVTLKALLEDEKASISIDNVDDITSKEIDLNFGDNKSYVKVVSESGSERIYTVKIIRSQSNDYHLLNLTTNVGTWDKEFDTDVKEYVIDVTNANTSIKFTGEYSNTATCDGLDTISLKVGENNHTIIVTSASGQTNTYTFTINRPGNSNTDILSITSNHGDLTLINGVYTIDVPDSASTISFDVTLDDPNAKALLDDAYTLNYGHNEIEFEVMAEDGQTKKTYTINVYRKKDLAAIDITDDVITLDLDEELDIDYSFEPSDTDDTTVTWSLVDEGIITLNNGHIKAIGLGSTYVYVRSTTNTLIYDKVKVIVASKKITSSVYDVWHIGDSENGLASVEFSYIIGINDKTTIDEVFANLDNDINTLKLYSNSEEINNYTIYAGTGLVIKLVVNDIVYDQVVVVVRGDNGTIEKPGNGIITSTDYATLSSLLAGLTLKTPMTSLLYDLNKNMILTVTDLSPLSLYIAGKATFTNLNGL